MQSKKFGLSIIWLQALYTIIIESNITLFNKQICSPTQNTEFFSYGDAQTLPDPENSTLI